MTFHQKLEKTHTDSMKWLGLDGLLDKSDDERIPFLFDTLNEKLKSIKTFEEFDLYFKHTSNIGQSRPFIKGTRRIASQFEAVVSPDGTYSHVRYDYGYGEGLEEWPISKLHERIEFRTH